MAAYAALVSLMNVLNRIQHPTCPVSLDQSQIQSLFHKVSYLVDFLEACSQRISKDFERKMIDAAFAVEDMIESFLVDRILAGDTCVECTAFSHNVEKAIQDMDLIVQGAMQVEEKNGEKDQQHKFLARVDSLLVPPIEKNKMVGLDEELIHLMERLTTDQSSRQIIPVVGMGGIGKTTLVRNVYDHPYVRDHFQIRAWVTVSQNYNVRSITRILLSYIGFRGIGQISKEQLEEKLYKGLWGRKYLIVLDDVWTSVVWDEVRRFFPDNENGSRVLLTTRLSGVALDVGSCSSYEMKLLDNEKSWSLLSQTVFAEEVCPPELEKLGKKIARSCKGLPLAIVVIGGLLKMSQMTREYWEDVAKNVISIISTESDGHCLEILSLSYNHLPVHLKPCFLYMATFIEDDSINTSELINLWVVDGFLKPVKNRSLEEVALEYLNDLVERNLIMATPITSNSRSTEYCSIHDSLRELCLREAQNERFLYPILQELNLPQALETERRLVYHLSGNESNSLLPPMPLARSFYCNKWGSPDFATRSRLLRVLHVFSGNQLQIDTTQLVNIRYLACQVDEDGGTKLLSSISLFWNLQVLIVSGDYENLILPSEIWEFTSLKCLIFRQISLPDPASARTFCILDDLRVLKGIKDFDYTNEVHNRIPNLRELSLYYDIDYLLDHPTVLSRSFINLARDDTIQALRCEFLRSEKNEALCVLELENLNFSPTLRELELSESHIPWEYMTIIGSLPNLEVLTLECDAFCGEEWNPIEGEFEHLKCLSISRCDLRIWNADSSHFPRLKRLFIEFLDLEEIPFSIGDVSSLELISLYTEKKSLVLSAKEILDEREDQGNHDLLIEGVYFMDTGYDEEKKLEEKTELEEMQMSNNNFRVQLFGLELEDEPEAASENANSNFEKLLVNMWKLDDANRKNIQKQLVKAMRSDEVGRIAETVSKEMVNAFVGAVVGSISKGISGAVDEIRTNIRTNIADASERMADAFSKKLSEGIGELFARIVIMMFLIAGIVIVVILLLFLLLIYVLYRSYSS